MLAGSSDHTARAVWAETVAALADGLSIGVALYDPGTVVIGGGLALAGPMLFGPLVEALDRRLTLMPAPRACRPPSGTRPALAGTGADHHAQRAVAPLEQVRQRGGPLTFVSVVAGQPRSDGRCRGFRVDAVDGEPCPLWRPVSVGA